MFDDVFKYIMNLGPLVAIIILVWFVFYIIQVFLAFGTAYRCTKRGNDNGMGLFIYLIGFSLAALIPGLGLGYYIRNLPPKKIVIQQQVRLTPEQIYQIQDEQRRQQLYQQQLAQQAHQQVRQAQAQTIQQSNNTNK